MANKNRVKAKANKRSHWLRELVSRFEIKAVLAFIPILAIYLTYKYTGADDLRSKVYSPLNAELSKVEGCLNANSMTVPLTNSTYLSLKQSGDFYRMPKSLQREIASFYDDAGSIPGHVSQLTELLQRQFSSRIQSFRSERSDTQWRQSATARILLQEQQQPGVSAIRTFTFNHAYVGRGIDVRNPNNPVISTPGGPIWQINDWLAYPGSLEKIDSIWASEDYLYFDDTRDVWYYRITRSDLEEHKIKLRDFLQPVYQLLEKDKNFMNIRRQDPELLRRLANLKAIFADRMDSPKQLTDLFY